MRTRSCSRSHAIRWLLFSLTMIVAPAAMSWGLTGHSIVGRVADDDLDVHPTTKQAVSAILDGNSLSEAAKWADCAKHYCGRPLTSDESAYVAANSATHHSFHYTDLPIQQSAYANNAAGTTPTDVVQIINEIVIVLRTGNAGTTPASLTKRQALWLLAHLVGDIHQPLHVGAVYFNAGCKKVVDPSTSGFTPNFGIGAEIPSTEGGNTLIIGQAVPTSSKTKPKVLHAFWDVDAVHQAMRVAQFQPTDVDNFGDYLATVQPAGTQTPGDVSTWAAQWATESLALARTAITTVKLGPPAKRKEKPNPKSQKNECHVPVALPSHYKQQAGNVATNQMARAGHRLAAMLVAIFEP